jgi:hypothetical protein
MLASSGASSKPCISRDRHSHSLTSQQDIGYFQGGKYLLNAFTFIMADFEQACNSATDLVLTFVPLIIFFNLQMKLTLKIGLAALLCLSIL